ncbi:MAG: hypothetical protein A3B70_04020 [Deltaproteobacteria bacterium RIFCSPHIGHO2_02_FULL_40_11]|nr:MAG: hypothetical protein A3B70_04020 [Deltaproteobacteria bacterium RIFCSPHIGHO2_02_FULL_40_11]
MSFLDKIKEQFSAEKLRETKLLEPIVIWYQALPGDQKNMVNIGAVGGVILTLLFFLYLGNSKVNALKEEIETKSRNLRELTKYQESFSEQTKILDALEKRFRQQGADFSLLTTLEKYAQSSQISRESIESISPRQLPPGEFFVETEATVQLVRVTLKQLVDYFYRIESAPVNLTLKEAHVKPRFDNPQFLNVSFKVIAYKPKE